MSTPIVRIKITELDTTTAAQAEDSLDVVYIPGLYGIKYVSFKTGVVPFETETTAEYAYVGDVFCNLADSKSYVCSYKETVEVTGTTSYKYTWDATTFYAPFFTEYDSNGDIDLTASETAIKALKTFSLIEPVKCTTPAQLQAAFGTYYYCESNGVEIGNSLDYALEIIKAGLPVTYHCGVKFGAGSETPNYYTMTATSADILSEMGKPTANQNSCFHAVTDHNEYDVKYFTSGVYPAGTPANTKNGTLLDEDILLNMIDAANIRGDAFALIDCGEGQSVKDKSMYNLLLSDFSGGITNGEYGAAFAPWAHYSISTKSDVLLPPSFGYLICYADSIKTNGSNLAIAGTTRGLVPGYKEPDIPATEKLNNAIADSWQDLDSAVNVNAITYIRNYGYCIWGNRTLHNNAKSHGLVDTSFLNIRNMLCDIKKRIRTVAMRLLFEQNNDVLWSTFLFGVSPIFERLKSTAGIASYKIVKMSCADKTKLHAVIKIVTVKPLEQVEVNIVMTDDNVDVE